MSASVEIATTIDKLNEVREKWSDLVCAAADSTPFHTPGWLLTWWKYFGSGTLTTALAWSGDELCGMAPCFIHQWANAEQLTLLGSGISDYLEPCLLSRDAAPAIAQAFRDVERWNRAVWQDLAAGSPFAIEELWPETKVSVTPDISCNAIPIAGDFDAFWGGRSKDLRRNLRRYRERARAQAPITFDCSRSLAPHVVEQLIRLHSLRWQRRGEPGTIESNNAGEFLRSVSETMSDNGLLRLFWIAWGDKIVAVSLGFEWKSEIFSYLSAFDPNYEPLGFGRILLYESLQRLWNGGVIKWNFLRGEEEYKRSWGAEPIEKCRLTVER